MNKHTTTETFYKEVITKVLDQSRDYFLQSNVNEDVLVELKKVSTTICYNICIKVMVRKANKLRDI